MINILVAFFAVAVVIIVIAKQIKLLKKKGAKAFCEGSCSFCQKCFLEDEKGECYEIQHKVDRLS